MASRVRRLNLTIGDLVEIKGRRYEVVPDRMGGVTLEPPITPMAELEKKVTVQVANAQDTAAPGSQGSRSARRPRTSRTSWPCLAAVPR